MRLAAVASLALTACVAAGAAGAADPEQAGVGPFRLGMSADQIRAAAPAVQWDERRSVFTGEVVSLKGRSAVSLAGAAFDLEFVPGNGDPRRLVLTRMAPGADLGTCRKSVFAVAAALEASFGPLEPSDYSLNAWQDEALAATFGRAAEVRVKGAASRLSVRTPRSGPAGWTSWHGARAQSADHVAVELGAGWAGAGGEIEPGCRMSVRIVHAPPTPAFETIDYGALTLRSPPTAAMKRAALDGVKLPAGGVDVVLDCALERRSGRVSDCKADPGVSPAYAWAGGELLAGYRFDLLGLDPERLIPLRARIPVRLAHEAFAPPKGVTPLRMDEVRWFSGPWPGSLEALYPADAGGPVRISALCEIQPGGRLICQDAVYTPSLDAPQRVREATEQLSRYVSAPSLQDSRKPSAGRWVEVVVALSAKP